MTIFVKIQIKGNNKIQQIMQLGQYATKTQNFTNTSFQYYYKRFTVRHISRQNNRQQEV